MVILCPNRNVPCQLTDPLLYELNYEESLTMDRYPEESSQVKMGTVAYHAERELDTLMYQDTGMYRNMQYGKANIISLQTMYEEIKILWDQELKYRPDFSVVDGVVNIPVILQSFRSQRRTYRRLLDIRKRTGHGRYSRDKKSALYRADGTESDENVCC